ncbi:MAG: hypothetical protein M1835_006472 [Candelina submexicana]|nr:MAG: hypothetical protein M1835_006472 [Candelina submexicana]
MARPLHNVSDRTASCYFLELPRELRDMIYQTRLCKSNTVHVNEDEERYYYRQRALFVRSLFTVSRQIRHEAIAAYFRWNHFDFEVGADLTMLFGRRARAHGHFYIPTVGNVNKIEEWTPWKGEPKGLFKEVIAGVQNHLTEVTLGYECDSYMDTALLLLPLAQNLRKVHINIHDLEVEKWLDDFSTEYRRRHISRHRTTTCEICSNRDHFHGRYVVEHNSKDYVSRECRSIALTKVFSLQALFMIMGPNIMDVKVVKTHKFWRGVFESAQIDYIALLDWLGEEVKFQGCLWDRSLAADSQYMNALHHEISKNSESSFDQINAPRTVHPSIIEESETESSPYQLVSCRYYRPQG